MANEIDKVADDVAKMHIGIMHNAYAKTNFVLNIPVYVEDENEAAFNQKYLVKDLLDLEYRTFKLKEIYKKQSPIESEMKKEETYEITKNVGSMPNNLTEANEEYESFDSKIEKILNLLEESHQDMKENLFVVFGLNRPRSVCDKKNQFLQNELNKKTSGSINHKKFAFSWELPWTDKNGKCVKYETVKEYYSKLKTDKPEEAAKFLDINENILRPTTPYQYIRECIKNHKHTLEFIKEIRNKNEEVNVYLSLADDDTVNFNGIYKEYIDKINLFTTKFTTPPTVMTTGYEFPKLDLEQGGYAFHLASQLDRDIRVATATYLPLGVYYPEPNMCILIEKNKETIEESFIDTKRKKCDMESACLIKNLIKNKERENPTFTFFNGKPLITSVPLRAKLTKNWKTPIKFSQTLKENGIPNDKDISSFMNISQNSYASLVWLNNLFINGSFGKKKKKIFSCICKLFKDPNNEETQQALKKVYSEKFQIILDAILSFKKIENDFKTKYIKQYEETLEDVKISKDLKKFILENPELDLDFNDLNKAELKETYDALLEIAPDDFEDFKNAKNRSEFSIEEILSLYQKDSLHLKFMSTEDINQLMYENSADCDFVHFGLENYSDYIDLDDIYDLLSNDDEEYRSNADCCTFQIYVESFYNNEFEDEF